MGVKTGDKSRYHRKRRKKLARREQMRALRKKASQSPPERSQSALPEKTR